MYIYIYIYIYILIFICSIYSHVPLTLHILHNNYPAMCRYGTTKTMKNTNNSMIKDILPN